jgi:site-specific DNA recombinase
VGQHSMIAAIYARKSTDDSNRDAEARSCERQIEHAKKYAAEQGWVVGPIFRDDAVSGAEWKHRPGFNALLAALEPRAPFGVLIVSELSRIGRDTVRTPVAVLQIEEAGVEVHGYLTRARISLADEAGEMSTMLGSLLASFERRRASDRTRDALKRRFEAGGAIGGAAYGYRVERNGGPYAHYAIESSAAQTVRDVFTWYDEGAGIGRIVKRLNAASVPAPRGGAWCVASVNLLLRRPIYAGLRAWGRSKNTMRGGTHGRQARPAGEWMEWQAPELALLDRELWERVQARLAARGASFLRSHSGRLIGRPRGGDVNAVYLLTGLLVCSRCGTSMTAVAPARNGRGRARYRCSSYHHQGVSRCGNGLSVQVAALDEAVLDAVAERLDAATVTQAVRDAVVLLTAGQADVATRRATLAGELATIATRERRLLDALVDGDAAVAASIKARLREELARRAELAAELTALDTAAPLDVGAILQDVEQRAGDLRGLLRRHPTQARQGGAAAAGRRPVDVRTLRQRAGVRISVYRNG